jgi:CRISPR-associated protein Csb1
MSDGQVNAKQIDQWVNDDSDVAALVMQQWLVPVEGKDAVIFPPTYARPEGMREEDWLGYNIDRFADGSSVCQIDSVGSQANRMEPMFKRKPYSDLVPQIIIKAKHHDVHLLDAGHRAADAIVRFSGLASDLESAFNSLKDGDATPLAKIAPTSLVFGSWDSRGTQVKVPRIARSVVRAFNARVLHRSAQYVPAIDYVNEGLVEEPANKTDQDRMSELGLTHVPAAWAHGGIQVLGEIRRDATVNLAALRTLAASTNGDKTLKLRRYILGLALVTFTAAQETSLREGCQLVPDTERPAEWQLVKHDGTRAPFGLTQGDALRYAEQAAARFEVGPDRHVNFNDRAVKAALEQSKEERQRSRRRA